MKKILALFIALAVAGTLGISSIASAATNANNSNTNKSTKTFDGTCVAAAVTVRDTAIMNAAETFNTAWQTALKTRMSDLVAAWKITNQHDRDVALQRAWKTYNDAWRTARKAFQKARTQAWTTYNKTRKTCKITSNTDTGSGVGNDSFSL